MLVTLGMIAIAFFVWPFLAMTFGWYVFGPVAAIAIAVWLFTSRAS